MEETVILSASRTPIGKYLGGLSDLSAPQLGAIAIAEALARIHLSPDRVEDVYMGCVLSAGLGQAPARQASIGAGIPHSVGATTVNKVCGSSLQTVIMASRGAVRIPLPTRSNATTAVRAPKVLAMSRTPRVTADKP